MILDTNKIYALIIGKKKSTGSGMMAPLLKKSMPSNNKMEKEPAFIVAKMYQRIKRDRMQIKEARNNA